MKKLLTLLLVAAMAVASFGVLTACGDKSGGGGEGGTTTSSTLEGEWYYKADMLYPGTNIKVPQEITIAIAKLADDDKTGEFAGMDYAAIVLVKIKASSLSNEELAMIEAEGEKPLGDGNLYAFGDFFAFEEKEDGDYSSAFADVAFPGLARFGKVEYKDNKLNVTLLCVEHPEQLPADWVWTDDPPTQPLNADWKYRALGDKPDINGTWTGTWTDSEDVDPYNTVTFEADDEHMIFVGRYAYGEVLDLRYDDEWHDDTWWWGDFMFTVADDMCYCTYTSPIIKVTKVTAAA